MKRPCMQRWAALCLSLLMHGLMDTGSAADAVLPAKVRGVGEFLALEVELNPGGEGCGEQSCGRLL